MRIPDAVRSGLREKLWALADELDWSRLSWHEKAAKYEAWTRDPGVGLLLANFIDQRQIRVYIKDTIMKGYVRSRLADQDPVMRVLKLDEESVGVAQVYERPHGLRLDDGRVIVWSTAKDWKAVLMVAHERAFMEPQGRPFAIVLFPGASRFAERTFRDMVNDAATKLLIEHVVWLD